MTLVTTSMTATTARIRSSSDTSDEVVMLNPRDAIMTTPTFGFTQPSLVTDSYIAYGGIEGIG